MTQIYQLFQFHKGTIRTTEMAVFLKLLTMFQFHKGTIRTELAFLQLCKSY